MKVCEILNFRRFFIVGSVLFIFFCSCTKDNVVLEEEQEEQQFVFKEDYAVEIISKALQENSGLFSTASQLSGQDIKP